MAKGKFSEKLLNFIGLEPTGEEEYDDDLEYDSDNEGENMMDDGMGYPPEEEYEPAPVEEKKFMKKNKDRAETGKIVGIPDTSKVRVLIYKPVSYEDTQSIIDNLKEKKPIVINLDELDTDVAQRILDFVSGAVYALNGNIRKAARNIFVVAPYNVDVSTNTADSVDDFGFGGYLDRD